MIKRAALAFVLLAAGSASAQSISIPVAGKSPAAVRLEVRKAAYVLCAREHADAFGRTYALPVCVRRSTEAAMAQLSPTGSARRAQPTVVAAK